MILINEDKLRYGTVKALLEDLNIETVEELKEDYEDFFMTLTQGYRDTIKHLENEIKKRNEN